MSVIKDAFRTQDGLSLSCAFHLSGTREVKASLIFVHGLGEHLGRYGNVCDYFLPRGYDLYFYDQRGHGASEGPRAFARGVEQLSADLDQFVDLVKKRRRSPCLFLLGHSLGGQVVVDYLAHHLHPLQQGLFQGFILSSPNIRVKCPISKLKLAAAGVIKHVLPELRVPNDIDPAWISRDPQVVRTYKRDPLVNRDISVQLAWAVLNHQKTLLDLAPKITLPAFLAHAGGDLITDPLGTQDFSQKLAGTDVTCKFYPEAYHELFNELCKDEVFGDMARWMERHL